MLYYKIRPLVRFHSQYGCSCGAAESRGNLAPYLGHYWACLHCLLDCARHSYGLLIVPHVCGRCSSSLCRHFAAVAAPYTCCRRRCAESVQVQVERLQMIKAACNGEQPPRGSPLWTHEVLLFTAGLANTIRWRAGVDARILLDLRGIPAHGRHLSVDTKGADPKGSDTLGADHAGIGSSSAASGQPFASEVCYLRNL